MASILSRTARKVLKPSRKPAYRVVERGLHLGYRKPQEGPGAWVVRRYIGHDRYLVQRLAQADDDAPANGTDVLDYAQALTAARGFKDQPGRAGPYTVSMAVADYLKTLEGQGRSPGAIRDAKWRADAFILPKLGEVQVAKLTASRLRKWRDDLATAAPRLRTKKGEAQKYADVADGDAQRARRATANRTWTILRAALNLAFQNDEVANDTAWRKVKPFAKVDAARQRWLTIKEAKKLINACEPDFRLLVRAALHTGCRFGELIALHVEDFHHNNGTLHIRESKSGHSRDVVLTDAGTAFFQGLCRGREAKEPILRNGKRAWHKSEQSRPMAAAVKKAELPLISFHGLRHTWASLTVQAGVPLLVVAKNLGHSGTRMVEKHYGHLAKSYMADAIRAGAPQF